MSIRYILLVPGSTFIQTLFQLIWTPILIGFPAIIGFYWDWFFIQHPLIKIPIVSILAVSLLAAYVLPRVFVMNTLGRRDARKEVIEAQKSIKNWAESILNGLVLDLRYDRPLTDYGDDQTRAIDAKNVLDLNDTQWKFRINHLVVELSGGYLAYQDRRVQMQSINDSQKQEKQRLRSEVKLAIQQVLHACNNIATLIRP